MLTARQRLRISRGTVALINVVGIALFPRRIGIFYPPLLRSPAGISLHVVYRVSFTYALHGWLIPRFHAAGEARRAAQDELTARSAQRDDRE